MKLWIFLVHPQRCVVYTNQILTSVVVNNKRMCISSFKTLLRFLAVYFFCIFVELLCRKVHLCYENFGWYALSCTSLFPLKIYELSVLFLKIFYLFCNS